MVNSNRRKRKLKHVAVERAKNRNRCCVICGKPLNKTMHHYYCNDHWKSKGDY